jgi:hypothetical protein
VLAAEPTGNAEASEAAENTDASEPAEPTDKIEPAEPIDRIDPLDPMLKMEPEDPGERDELTGTCIRTFWQQRLPARHSRPGHLRVAQPADRPRVRSAA